MTILTFNNVTLKPVNRNDGQLWLTSADLANALGYSRADKVTQIFNRNTDEFNQNMTASVEISREPQNEGLGNLTTKTRIFSLRGCHLIAMFAKTKVAKDFRKWVLDVLEHNQKTTAKQREVFINACDKLAVNNNLRSKVYTNVANHFGYDKPVDIPVDLLPEAIAYVYEELLAQEKINRKTTQAQSDTQSIKHLVTSYFYVYEWYKQIEPAIDIINPKAIGSIREHIDRCKVYANTLNRNHQIGMSDDKVKYKNFGLR